MSDSLASPRADDDADDTPAAESLKRQLMTRAGVAAGLIVLLLMGLALYDRMHRVTPQPPAPSTAPAMPVPGTPAGPAAGGDGGPAAATENSAENAAEAGLQRDTPPEPEMSSAPVLAPPGQRQPDAPEPLRGAPRLVLGGEPAAPLAPRPAHPPAPAEPPPVAAGHGYLVQVGVFGSTENAEALRNRLAGLGIPARLESRVVVGPFPDKAAARAAQARLQEAGQSPGLIVPPRP
jgi:DedD protein